MRTLCNTTLFSLTLGLLSLACHESEVEGPPPMDPVTVTSFPSDEEVERRVEDELSYDTAVPHYAIDVAVDDGVVSLTGEVEDLRSRNRARRIAETVRGVRAVIDRIDVQPTPGISEETLEKHVETALLADPATDSYEVQVEVDADHIVHLEGKVSSWAEKTLCSTVASDVRGVRGIQNDLEIAYGEARDDAEIEAEIERLLDWNTLVDDGLIQVTVADGVVRLSGVVGSASERTEARYTAWTRGVEDVLTDDLVVRHWARDTKLRDRKYVARTDGEIERAVHSALLRDPRVSSFDVLAVAANGVVTLRGVVDNLEAKRAAERDALSTVGVRDVVNELNVEPVEMRLDARIEDDVENRYESDPVMANQEIEVRVHDRVVNLQGIVDTSYERRLAESLAARVRGVEDVQNLLVVRDPSPLGIDPRVDRGIASVPPGLPEGTRPAAEESDEHVRRAIERELEWSPFVTADTITVTVEEGRATLEGTAKSIVERSAAIRNAYEGGATVVFSEIEIISS